MLHRFEMDSRIINLLEQITITVKKAIELNAEIARHVISTNTLAAQRNAHTTYRRSANRRNVTLVRSVEQKKTL